MDARGVPQKNPLFRRFWTQCEKGRALCCARPFVSAVFCFRFPPIGAALAVYGVFSAFPETLGLVGDDLRLPTLRLIQGELRTFPIYKVAVQADDIALPLAPRGV